MNSKNIYYFKILGLTDVIENQQNTDNLIYPNPASDFLNIQSSDLLGKEVTIYNMLGTKLITAKAESNDVRMNIESLPAGVYLLKAGEHAKLFVKE